MESGNIVVHHDSTLRIVQTVTLPTTIEAVNLNFVNFGVELKSAGEVQFLALTKSQVFAIVMRALDTQIAELLADKNLHDALIILEQIDANEQSFDEDKRLGIYQVAALNFYKLGMFENALAYFKRAKWDPLQLVKIYDELEIFEPSELINPTKRELYSHVVAGTADLVEGKEMNKPNTLEQNIYETFQQEIKSLTNLIGDLEISPKNESPQNFEARKRNEAFNLLAEYLEFTLQEFDLTPKDLKEIDTALAKCFAVLGDQEKLTLHLEDSICDLDIVQHYFQKKEYHYSLSLIHKHLNNAEKVLNIWVRICQGQIIEPLFPGVDKIVEYLIELQDKQIILKYSIWVLSRVPVKGIKIFTARNDELFSTQETLDFLENFSSSCRIQYLEHQTALQNYNDVDLNTTLARNYLSELSQNHSIVEELNGKYTIEAATTMTFVEFLKSQISESSITRLKFYSFIQKAKIKTIEIVDPCLNFEKAVLVMIY